MAHPRLMYALQEVEGSPVTVDPDSTIISEEIEALHKPQLKEFVAVRGASKHGVD